MYCVFYNPDSTEGIGAWAVDGEDNSDLHQRVEEIAVRCRTWEQRRAEFAVLKAVVAQNNEWAAHYAEQVQYDPKVADSEEVLDDGTKGPEPHPQAAETFGGRPSPV